MENEVILFRKMKIFSENKASHRGSYEIPILITGFFSTLGMLQQRVGPLRSIYTFLTNIFATYSEKSREVSRTSSIYIASSASFLGDAKFFRKVERIYPLATVQTEKPSRSLFGNN